MNESDMRNKQKQIVKLIQKYPTVICQRHQLPDPDAIGSQMGLAEIIKKSFPHKKVLCAGSQDPTLSWMGKEDNVKDSDYKNALVIVSDTANRPRISDQRFNQGKALVKIDHHPNVDKFGDVQLINPKASSASEMVYDLVQSSPKLHLDDKSARFIYAGMVGDTGRFMYPNANSAHTLAVASHLARYHFDMAGVNRKEDEISMPVARLSANVYQHMHQFKNGTAYYIADNKTLNKLHVHGNQVMPAVNLPGRIKGVKAWGTFTEQKNGGYRVSLRSHAPAINQIASKYGGGGHALASGAFVKDKKTVMNMVHDLYNTVNKYNKKQSLKVLKSVKPTIDKQHHKLNQKPNVSINKKQSKHFKFSRNKNFNYTIRKNNLSIH